MKKESSEKRNSQFQSAASNGDCSMENRNPIERKRNAFKVINLRPRPGETRCYKGDCNQDYPPG